MLLRMRLYLLLVLLFAIIYTALAVVGRTIGIENFYFYLFLSLILMWVQYMIGPKIVEWSMKVEYIDENKHPYLHRMVAELACKANIPKPRVGIANISIPNAFAFGRGVLDSRVCVTRGILQLLNEEELRAVLGHEITHLKNRDVIFITILSVIPIVFYRIAWHILWFGPYSRRREQGPSIMFVGLLAFLFYFITNLLVLYASRIREYFADRGAVMLGNHPSALASALYKLVYGSAKLGKEIIKDAEGLKAFFVSDPSRALQEIRELRQIDIDRSGTIDPYELEILQNKRISLSWQDRLLELLSTHPNILKRIKQLSKIQVVNSCSVESQNNVE